MNTLACLLSSAMLACRLGVGVGVVTGTRSQSGNGRVHSPDMASHVAVAAKARTVLIARLRTSRGVETLRGVH